MSRVIPRLRLVVLGVLAVWAVVSLAEVPPLDIADLPTRGSPVAVAFATAGLGLYALALVRYVALFLRRPTGMLLGLIIGLALLAEATLATALAPQWHASWGWHLLILAAAEIVAVTAHTRWHEERFGDLYLASTAEGTRDLTVLFADLQGFTRFSEANPPAEVSRMLNRYLAAAVPAIVRRHGGDGIALGAETARRVAGERTEPLGQVALKGRDATVEALLLVALEAAAPVTA